MLIEYDLVLFTISFMYIYIYTCVHNYVYIYKYICKYKRKYICKYMCLHIQTYVYIHKTVYIYIYKYILGAICSFSRRIKKPLDNSSETWTDPEFRPAEFAGNGNDFPHKSPK